MEEYKPLFVDEEHSAPPPPPQPEWVPPPPERFDTTLRDGIFAALIAIGTLLTVRWGLWHNFRVGWTVSFLLLFVISTVYIFRKGIHVTPFSATCGGLSAILAFTFSTASTFSVRFFAFFVSIALLLIWFGTTVADRNNRGDLGVLCTATAPIFRLGFRYIPTTLRSLFTGGKQSRTIGKIMIGVAISIPTLCIVIPLLMKSDVAFDGLATSLFDDLGATVGQLIVGAMLALFVVPYCMALRHRTLAEPERGAFGGVDGVVLGTVLSLLSLCYLAYLFSQLAYFFSGFGGFLPEGYTFTVAEYARRGFFEMSSIAAINLFVIFLVQLLARQKDGKMHGLLRTLCAFIAVFTLLIIATAVSKMVLYIELFGMTTLRITTTAFMVFLAIVFLSVIVRLFTPRVKVLKTAVVTAGVILAVLGLCNVDRVVVEYNYHAYQQGWLKEIDLSTIKDAGDEGVPFMLKLTEDKDVKVAYNANMYMLGYFDDWTYYERELVVRDEEHNSDYWYKLGEKQYDEWTEWSLPRRRAYDALEQYVEENPLLFSESGTVNS